MRLKPQDSFDLIRVIAKSQSDARKAIGELVQNSLDAGVRHVEITWFNDKGTRTLRIADDGRGVFPELEREAVLSGQQMGGDGSWRLGAVGVGSKEPARDPI